MTKEQIEYMVQRFLRWQLPGDFHPDGGVTFTPVLGKDGPHPVKAEPTGTNLFSYTQAKAMIEHMADGMPQQITVWRSVGKGMPLGSELEVHCGDPSKTWSLMPSIAAVGDDVIWTDMETGADSFVNPSAVPTPTYWRWPSN